MTRFASKVCTAQLETTAPSQRQRRVDLLVSLAMLIFAATWRIWAGLLTPITQLYGDMVHYDHITIAILGHHVYSYWGTTPDAQITPGYPLFLSLCYAIANLFWPNHSFQLTVAVIGQSLLSGISTYLVYKISRYMMPTSFALLTSILFFLYPSNAWAPTILLTETLYVCMLLLSIYIFFAARARQRPFLWLLCGLSFGLCTLVRPTVFVFLIAPIIIWAMQRKLRPLRGHIFYLLGFIAPLVPWWIRNIRAFHRIILTDMDAGNPLLFGSDPDFRTDASLGHGLDPSGQTSLALHRIIFGFSHHFWTYAWWYTGEKLALLFSTPWLYELPPAGGRGWSAFVIFRVHLHLVWVILGVLGMLLGIRHHAMRFMSSLFLILILLQLPFIPTTRYAYPVMPFLFIGVGFFLYKICSLLCQRLPLLRKTCYAVGGRKDGDIQNENRSFAPLLQRGEND